MKRFLIVILVLGLVFIGIHPAVAKDVIKIGHPGDFSGPYSFYDSPVRNGAQLAIDEINASGGILGMQLEYIAKDGRNEQGLAVRLTE